MAPHVKRPPVTFQHQPAERYSSTFPSRRRPSFIASITALTEIQACRYVNPRSWSSYTNPRRFKLTPKRQPCISITPSFYVANCLVQLLYPKGKLVGKSLWRDNFHSASTPFILRFVRRRTGMTAASTSKRTVLFACVSALSDRSQKCFYLASIAVSQKGQKQGRVVWPFLRLGNRRQKAYFM